MDFSFSDDQLALRDLAREILTREITPETLRAIEREKDWLAAGAWRKLAEAHLLGLAVPEAHGGMGMGMIELGLLLAEVGRAVAPLPVVPTLVLGGLPVARFGDADQQSRWLAPLAQGDAILTGALLDAETGLASVPGTRARREGAVHRLDGRKRLVPAAHLARRILVPASGDGGVGLFLVDPRAAGVALTRQRSSTHEPRFELELRGAAVAEEDVLGGELSGGESRLAWLLDCARVATAATQLGVCERALEITTAYVSERVQFGAPIGSFPPVQHRAADCFIDLACLRWTTWRAAWKLAENLPAGRDAAVAKFWAADAGARIATAAQHLHGGMGADRDYPIHRYLLWSKTLELEWGAAAPELARLGRDLARTGPPERP